MDLLIRISHALVGRRAIVLSQVVLLVLLLGCSERSDPLSAAPSGPNPGQTQPAASFAIAFAVSQSTAWASVREIVKPDDFVLVPASSQNRSQSIALAQQIVAEKPGVHVVFGDRPGGLNSVTTMESYLSANPLPEAIEYLLYDFEPGYQPEFTFVQADALSSFEQAKTIAETHGKKIFPTPFNPFRTEANPQPWDMGAIALRSHDAMDVQLQQSLNPANPGGGLDQFRSHARRVRDDVRRVCPDMRLFVQISFALNTAGQLADAATWVKAEGGFAGVFIVYDMNDPAALVDLVRAIR